jgi:hypothetical protein
VRLVALVLVLVLVELALVLVLEDLSHQARFCHEDLSSSTTSSSTRGDRDRRLLRRDVWNP